MSGGDPVARQTSVPFHVCAGATSIKKDVKCAWKGHELCVKAVNGQQKKAQCKENNAL